MSNVAIEDRPRLGRQLGAVLDIMTDGQWRTLEGIQELLDQEFSIQASTPSISARLRDLRKEKYGGRIVNRRKALRPGGTVIPGLFEYCVV